MPPGLWFKLWMAAEIIAGKRTFTIRKTRPRALYEGEIAIACAGPTHPFAVIRIMRIRQITVRDISMSRRAALEEIYGPIGTCDVMWRIDFQFVRAQDHF